MPKRRDKKTIFWVLFIVFIHTPGMVFSSGGEPENASDMPISIIQLEEQWRISSDDDQFLIGEIVDIAQDKTGKTYILDFQQQVVLVFNQNGGFIASFGGKGNGPGETNFASRIIFDQDNNFALMEMFPPKFVWFDDSGTPLQSQSVSLNNDGSGLLQIYDARFKNNLLVAALRDLTPRQNGKPVNILLASLTDEGNLFNTLWTGKEPVEVRNQTVFFEKDTYNFVYGCWDLSQSGAVFFAPYRDQFTIKITGPESNIDKEVCYKTNRKKRTKEEKERERSHFLSGFADNQKIDYIVEDYAPCINKLWVHNQGRGEELWIETAFSYQNLPNGAFVKYDVLGLDGRQKETVVVLGDADGRLDWWFILPNQTLIMARNFKNDEGDNNLGNYRRDESDIKVICFKMVPITP